MLLLSLITLWSLAHLSVLFACVIMTQGWGPAVGGLDGATNRSGLIGWPTISGGLSQFSSPTALFVCVCSQLPAQSFGLVVCVILNTSHTC